MMLYSVFTRPWTCYTWHVTSDTDPRLVVLDIRFMTPAHGIYTGTWRVTLDIWSMTPALGIYTGTQYLHHHLACYTWYMIYDTGTRYLHRYSAFTLALGMLHLIYDIWHRYFPCYIWHMIPDTGTWHAILATWYMTPVLLAQRPSTLVLMMINSCSYVY